MEIVQIGDKQWMKKNLEVTHFRNGIELFYAKNESEWEYASNNQIPAYCDYENNPDLGEIFGKLYNFYAVKSENGLAPIHFNIPTVNDWIIMANQNGGIFKAGSELKSVSFWENSKKDFISSNSDFEAFPGGLRYSNGQFDLANSNGFWWTCTEQDHQNAIGINLFYDDFLLLNRHYYKGNGFSVRCIKINPPILAE